MGRLPLPYEVRERLFDSICAGRSLWHSARLVGVSRDTAGVWWRQSAPVTLTISYGPQGGLGPARACAVPARDLKADPGSGAQVRRPLSSEDRAVIAAGLQQRAHAQRAGCRGPSLASIGALIGRHRSVISREIARNSGPDGSYYGSLAHRQALLRRRRPKPFRLVENPDLCRRIEDWMDAGWSPKLIATVLRGEDPRTIMDRVSHETIYQALYVQTRGSLRQDLARNLSTARHARKPRGDAEKRSKSPYREAFTISQRPAEVTDRAVPGHWEGDLILGTANASAVGTLVERSTRFVILLHLPGRHDAASVAEAMIREMGKLPEHLRRSVTWDRGTELAGYRDIQLALDMPLYFCDPHSPWQRGTNENSNRLLRFWLTKGTDLSTHTAEDLAHIAATLNKRPRPTLDLKTPAQALAELLSNPTAA